MTEQSNYAGSFPKAVIKALNQRGSSSDIQVELNQFKCTNMNVDAGVLFKDSTNRAVKFTALFG